MKNLHIPDTTNKPKTLHWTAAGALIVMAATGLFTWSASDKIMPQLLAVSLRILLLDVAVALAIATVISLVFRFTLGKLKLFKPMPSRFLWCLLFGLVVLATLGAGVSRVAYAVVVAMILFVCLVIGLMAGDIFKPDWRLVRGRRKAATYILVSLSALILVFGSLWLAYPAFGGSSAAHRANAVPVTSASPAYPGPYQVKYMTYGSGTDTLRPEYRNVTLKTQSVDASGIISGWSGSSGAARTKLWGFDVKALPLNARVWYPDGSGTFPLVLIVHGNKDSAEFSDAGYEYLGKLLASRGYIAVSIDENFLNTSLIDKTGGLDNVNAARGWMLLKHLDVWRQWSQQAGNPFQGKVDMDTIALIGHSRGGEAVSIAAYFNTLPALPEKAAFTFNFNYHIKTVIALAPSDSQYLPGGKKIVLQHTNYLTLQGSQDADVASFGGLSQYARTLIPGGSRLFKSAVQIDGADHDQFNTSWGSYDIGQGLPKRFINTAKMLTPDAQRQIAQVYSSAFLDKTLKANAAYDGLFAGPTTTAKAWLPHSNYKTVYNDDTQQALQPENSQAAYLPLRTGPSDFAAVKFSWTAGQNKTLIYHRTDSANAAGSRLSALRIDAALADNATDPSAVMVMFSDTAGQSVSVRLNQFDDVLKPFDGVYVKGRIFQNGAPYETIPQTLSYPAAALQGINPKFNLSALDKVTFAADATQPGAIYIGNVGLTE